LSPQISDAKNQFAGARLRIVKRLFARQIAGQQKFALGGNPERRSEHAVKALEQVLAVMLVKVTNHLAVGTGLEQVAFRFKFAAQLPIIVDLAIVEQCDAAIGVEERLVAAVQIVDREPAHPGVIVAVVIVTGRIRTAVTQRRHHRLDRSRSESARTLISSYAAHEFR